MTTPNTPATTDDLATDVELMPTNTANALDDQAFASLEKYARSMDVADRIAEGIYRTDYAGPFKGKKADMAIAILSAAGLGPQHVLKTTVYVANMDDFALVNQLYAEAFQPPYPAREVVQAARLPKNGLVEISAIAAE